MRTKALMLGTDENYFDFEMNDELRSQHMHVMGATGTGKSRFLLSLILQDIKNRKGLCLIDPHGELVDHVVDWLCKNDHIAERRKVRILRLRDREWSFGFNPLAVPDENRLDAIVDQAVSGIASVMGGNDLTQTPLLRMSLYAAFIALASARLTLNEATYLLSPDYQKERLAITSKITNPTYAKVWESLNQLADKNPQVYLDRFSSAERRFTKFISNPYIQAILGQNDETLDLKKCMDDGEVLLVDLSLEGGYIPPKSAKIIGRLLVNNLVARSYERPPRSCRPFNLYIDEVQNYLSGDIPEILSQCRKFGLHLTMAHQFLGQLRNAGDLIYDGLMGSALNKVVFALKNPRDAEEMQRLIFAGEMNFERPKQSLIKPTVVGHEIVKLWSEGSGTNQSGTTSLSINQTATQADGHAFSESYSSGQSAGETSSSSDVIGMLDGQELAVTRHSQSLANSEVRSSGENIGSSRSYADGISRGLGRSAGATKGTSTNRGYSETLKPIFQEMPTAVYSRDEMMHIFTDSIITLPARTAYGVLVNNGMVKFETLDVSDLIVAPTRKQCFFDDLSKLSELHRPFNEVNAEIESRVVILVEKEEEDSQKKEEDFDVWE